MATFSVAGINSTVNNVVRISKQKKTMGDTSVVVPQNNNDSTIDFRQIEVVERNVRFTV